MNDSSHNHYFDQPLSSVNTGLSSKIITSLKEFGIKTYNDLIWQLPNTYLSLKNYETDQLLHNDFVQGSGKVTKIEIFNRKSSFFRRGKMNLINCTLFVSCTNQKLIKLTFFNLYPSQHQKLSNIENISFWGKIDCTGPLPTIFSPNWRPNKTFFTSTQAEYPTINKIAGHQWSKIFTKIPLSSWDNINEPLPAAFVQKRFKLNLRDAFKLLHQVDCQKPPSLKEIEAARYRLIYHEFFIDHFRLLERKKNKQKTIRSPIIIDSSIIQNVKRFFTYELTDDQLNAVNILIEEITKGHQISRLIQGDVGCGKTTVALIIAYAINQASGGQVAVMCPTESLAQQHFKTFKKILPADYPIALLLGSTSTKEKKAIFKSCLLGEIKIIIGTHSLINPDLKFKNLSLAVIDEQHRFGVDQRLALLNKSPDCHCILMTATPIPRTLLIAQYGDLDITTIHTMPKNRAKRSTRVISEHNFSLFLSFVKTRILDLKEQAFFVVPAIEEADDLTDLEQIFTKVSTWFPEFKIGKVHGKLSFTEKEEALNLFYTGELQILVCTSVIEVGIDVPNSSIMAIFNPERFGLSSLHQLRGRVARGNKPGFCFLVTQNKLTKIAESRLNFLEQNEDGFKISEYDLINRGGGNIFGSVQSGTESRFHIASVSEHYHILNQFVEDLPEINLAHNQCVVKQSAIENAIIQSL